MDKKILIIGGLLLLGVGAVAASSNKIDLVLSTDNGKKMKVLRSYLHNTLKLPIPINEFPLSYTEIGWFDLYLIDNFGEFHPLTQRWLLEGEVSLKDLKDQVNA